MPQKDVSDLTYNQFMKMSEPRGSNPKPCRVCSVKQVMICRLENKVCLRYKEWQIENIRRIK